MFRETRFFRNLGSFVKLRNSQNSSLIFAKHENRFLASFVKFSRNEISSKTLTPTLLVHATWPGCMSMLHVHAAFPCCISMLHVHSVCPCYMSMLHMLHASCMCKLHVKTAYRCCTPILHVHTVSMFNIHTVSMFHVHVSILHILTALTH